jgi:hypothetical protein
MPRHGGEKGCSSGEERKRKDREMREKSVGYVRLQPSLRSWDVLVMRVVTNIAPCSNVG